MSQIEFWVLLQFRFFLKNFHNWSFVLIEFLNCYNLSFWVLSQFEWNFVTFWVVLVKKIVAEKSILLNKYLLDNFCGEKNYCCWLNSFGWKKFLVEKFFLVKQVVGGRNLCVKKVLWYIFFGVKSILLKKKVFFCCYKNVGFF